ncbi:protein of unknown function (plasmid) [Azospirillum baldaniorum]|uniref:Uncharacterized protein n=1 Tax=Azospirillum baldaniorum TaxID=1064539 RepID=A0A9P1JXR5_9PROT|nr:protein of unknown function [Azospirillum baldaniorum]
MSVLWKNWCEAKTGIRSTHICCRAMESLVMIRL